MSDKMKGEVVKVGHTSGWIYAGLLQQYIDAPRHGYKIVDTYPRDPSGFSAVTLTMVPVEDDVELDSDVKTTLRTLSHVTCAVGDGRGVSVENISVSEDEEAKYIITIKKRRTGDGDVQANK